MATRTDLIRVGLAVGLAGLASCAPGHGKYTEAFRQQANANMERVRAGTTWDLARQRFLAGDLAKALDDVDESISRAPDVAKSHRLRGRILMEQGRLEDALTAFERAAELDTEDAFAQYYRGLVFERWSRFTLAHAAFEKAAALDPTDPQFAVASAEMLIQSDRLADAEAALHAAAERFEHNAGVRQTLGHLAMMTGDTSGAVAHFEAACLLAPGEAGLLEDLARAHIAAGDFAEAEYAIARVFRLAEDEAPRRDVRHLHARVLLELDRPVEARRIYESLTSDERGSSDAAAWLGLGRCALIVGNSVAAADAAARLIEIAPERPDGPVLLATALHAGGDEAGAVSALRGVERLTGAVATALVYRSELQRGLGKTSAALRSAELALTKDPASPVAERLVAELRASVREGAVVDVTVEIDG